MKVGKNQALLSHWRAHNSEKTAKRTGNQKLITKIQAGCGAGLICGKETNFLRALVEGIQRR